MSIKNDLRQPGRGKRIDGHSQTAPERYAPDTRHMVILPTYAVILLSPLFRSQKSNKNHFENRLTSSVGRDRLYITVISDRL